MDTCKRTDTQTQTTGACSLISLSFVLQSFWVFSLNTNSHMEVCFLASGETLTVLAADDFRGKTAKALKEMLAAQAGVPRFRQRLFQEDGSCEIKDDEILDVEAVKVSLVRLEFCPSDPEQTHELLTACQHNDFVMLEALLQRPCDPNTADEFGWTPLHYSAERGHLEVSRILLEGGADKDAQEHEDLMTPLFIAAAEGHPDIVALLLEAGSNKDQPQRGGATPLFTAAANGHLDSVRLLVESRAAINQADDRSETPLIASVGHLEIVKLLVASGARCDIKRNDGFTAIDWATRRRHVEVVRFLDRPTLEHIRSST